MPPNSSVAVTFECYFYNCFDSPCAVPEGLTIEHGYIIGVSNPEDNQVYGYSCCNDFIGSFGEDFFTPIIGNLNPITANSGQYKINSLLVSEYAYGGQLKVVIGNMPQSDSDFVHCSVKITFEDYNSEGATNVFYLSQKERLGGAFPAMLKNTIFAGSNNAFDYVSLANNLTIPVSIEVNLATGREQNISFSVIPEHFTDSNGDAAWGFSKDEVGDLFERDYYNDGYAGIPSLETAFTIGLISDESGHRNAVDYLYLSIRDNVKSLFIRTNKHTHLKMQFQSILVRIDGELNDVESFIMMTYNPDTDQYEHDKDLINQAIVDKFL